MSKVFTVTALQSRSNIELQTLMRKVQHDIARSAPGSSERRNALANLDNIAKAMSHRRFQS